MRVGETPNGYSIYVNLLWPKTNSFLPLLPSFLGLAESLNEPNTVYMSVYQSATKVLILPAMIFVRGPWSMRGKVTKSDFPQNLLSIIDIKN